MSRIVPKGWTKVDKYHMRNGTLYIARVYIGGRMKWALWNDKAMVDSAWDDENGFERMVELSRGAA